MRISDWSSDVCSSDLNQAPSNNAKATVAQTGNANQSYVDQTLALTGGDNTTATVAQTGNRNYSYVDQSAAENDAFVTQTSNDRYSTVLQLGANSTATFTQTGNAQVSFVNPAIGKRPVRNRG